MSDAALVAGAERYSGPAEVVVQPPQLRLLSDTDFRASLLDSDVAGAAIGTDLALSLVELRKRYRREHTICTPQFRDGLVGTNSELVLTTNMRAIAEFATSTLVAVEVDDEATLRINGEAHDIKNPDELFVWNMLLQNHPHRLLARDITTNPLFGHLDAKHTERQQQLRDVQTQINSRHEQPIMQGHGNNKGRRYGLEPYVHLGPLDPAIDRLAATRIVADQLDHPAIVRMTHDVLDHYPLEAVFTETVLYLLGIRRDRVVAETPLATLEVKKAITYIAGKGVAKARPAVAGRIREYNRAANAGVDDAEKAKSLALSGKALELLRTLGEAAERKVEWIDDATCKNTDPALFYPVAGPDDKNSILEHAAKAEAVIGTWCDSCPVAQECLEYGREIAAPHAGLRIMGGKLLGLSARQATRLVKKGFGALMPSR